MFAYRNVTFRAVAFLMLLCALPLFSEDFVCTVKGVVGDVKVNRSRVRREEAVSSTAGFRAVQINMILRERDVIQTSAQSEVRLETPDGSIITLGENTTLEIAAIRHSSKAVNTKVRLVGGSMVTNVQKLTNKRSTFEIQTPTATAAVRGTIVELEIGTGGVTEIKVFDGKVNVAPANSKKFVEVGDRQAVQITPRQRKLVVTEVPKDYKPRSTRLKGEECPEEAAKRIKESQANQAAQANQANQTGGAGAAGAALVKLSLALDDELADTLKKHAKEPITIKGTVTPPSAKVSINGKVVKPDRSGAFKHTMRAPADSGVFTLRVVANDNNVSETVLRTVKVGNTFKGVKLVTPVEGQEVAGPYVLVSGTAVFGSKVNVGDQRIDVDQNGNFSASVALPAKDKDGNVKLEIEIVDGEDNAVWFIRNVKHKKGGK
ncbi:MAG: FecR family protein [Chitinispirillia bacterium]|nr:FecR family protein [Chitinispirillia bacterium]